MTSEIPVDVAVAAFLHAEHGMTQTQCAEKMGISQTTASRLLAAAKKAELYEEERRFRGNRDDPELTRRLAEILGHERSVNAIRDFQANVCDPSIDERCYLRDVQIVDLPGPDRKRGRDLVPGGVPESPLQEFGRQAGELLSLKMADEFVFGLSWGAVLYFTCQTFLRNPPDPSRLPKFIPASPNIRTGSGHYSSTAIAGMMNQRYNPANVLEGYSSLSVPAFIPRAYSDAPARGEGDETEREKFVRLMLESSEDYRNTLGGYGDKRDHSKAAKRFGTFLTGLGGENNPFGKNFVEFAQAVESGDALGITMEEVKKLYVGDFAGDLLVRPDLSETHASLANELRKLWTGITVADLREIARQAGEKRDDGSMSHGVVVLGTGRSRSKVLLEALKLGAVSKIYVDQALHDQLMQDLSEWMELNHAVG